MPTSRQSRGAVLSGIVTAWALSIAFVWLGLLFTDKIDFVRAWSAEQAAIFAMLVAGLTLAFGIGWAARTRFFVSNIDGSPPKPGQGLDIILRYVSNTTEQLILFCIAVVGIAVAAHDLAPKLLPVLGCLFVLARIGFLVGYLYSPLARAVGFAATFHPTVAALFFALWKLFQ